MEQKISKHISYDEGVRSITALRLGLNNDPSDAHLRNMKLLSEKIFEPLRMYVGGPIRINSFYRAPELNKAIGGSRKSQHCHGQAMDIDDTFGVMSNSTMFNWIQDHSDFDQLIWEFGDENNPDWVHVSYVNPGDNRNRCLRAKKCPSGTTYSII